jgi:hypothetical protein
MRQRKKKIKKISDPCLCKIVKQIVKNGKNSRNYNSCCVETHDLKTWTSLVLLFNWEA